MYACLGLRGDGVGRLMVEEEEEEAVVPPDKMMIGEVGERWVDRMGLSIWVIMWCLVGGYWRGV